MKAQIMKTIAGFFVFIDFHYIEIDSPHTGVCSKVGLVCHKAAEGGGLIKSLWYHLPSLETL